MKSMKKSKLKKFSIEIAVREMVYAEILFLFMTHITYNITEYSHIDIHIYIMYIHIYQR